MTVQKDYSLEPAQKSVGLPKELGAIGETLKTCEIKEIDQAIEAWAEIAGRKPDMADRLLAKVGVDQYSKGSLHRLGQGPRFSHGDPSKNQYLTYGLMGLLSMAPLGTRGAYLREHIEKLEIITPEIPMLLGFTSLKRLELRIQPSVGLSETSQADWQERVAGLQCLRELKLVIANKKHSPPSLQPFRSAYLESVDIHDENLASIEGLEHSKKLRQVKIFRSMDKSDQCIDLSPLASCVDTLNELDLLGCGIEDLAPISKCKDLRKIDISFNNIRSIKDMPTINGKSLTVPISTNQISSLEGIERQHKIKDLHIIGPVSGGLELLERLSNLEYLDINSNIQELPDLSSLESLQRLKISSQSLRSLPLKWPPSLHELNLEHCYNVASLGKLPSSLRGCLDFSQFTKLESLDGIEACSELDEAKVTIKCRNISAAGALPDLWLTLILKGGKTHSELPVEWIKQLAAVTSCKLRPVINRANSLRELANLNDFAAIPGLKALDLSDLDVRDPSAILRMEKLEYLCVQPRSSISQKLGAVTISGEDKIATLKLKLMAIG